MAGIDRNGSTSHRRATPVRASGGVLASRVTAGWDRRRWFAIVLTVLMIVALVPSPPGIAQESPLDVREHLEPEAQEDSDSAPGDDGETEGGDTADDGQDSEGDDGQQPAEDDAAAGDGDPATDEGSAGDDTGEPSSTDDAADSQAAKDAQADFDEDQSDAPEVADDEESGSDELDASQAAAPSVTAEQEVEPLAAGPPVYEIEGVWVDPPATISRGNPVVGEWRVNVNDSGEPPSNDPVDNVVVEFVLDKAFFDDIPDLCQEADADPPVDPPSSISEDGTVLTCNLGTVDMGTAIVVQTPVVANGITLEEVTLDGTIDGQTVNLPPIEILNPFQMDIHYGGNTPFEAWDDIDDPNFVDVDVQWSLRLGKGSDPGKDELNYVLDVSDINGNNVNVGVHPDSGLVGCSPYDRNSADGHPWSRPDLPPDHHRNTSFVDTCTLTERGNTGVFDLTLSGIDYDLLNAPTHDANRGGGNPLPPNWNYIATGSLWFRVFTAEAGSITLESNAPTYEAPTGQESPDLPGNNTTTKTYQLPGGFSASWQRGYTQSGGTAWDDSYRVSTGTELQMRVAFVGATHNPPSPDSMYGDCLIYDPAFVTHVPGSVIVDGRLPNHGVPVELDPPPEIEYYTGTNPLVTPGSGSYDPEQFTCGEDPDGWTTDEPTDPADVDDVKAVRVQFPHSYYADQGIGRVRLFSHVTVDDDTPVGQDVWMFGSRQRNDVWEGPELGNARTTTPDARYANTNLRRDIVRIVTAVPFLEKAAAASTVTPGVPAEFTLTYSATGSGIIPDTVDDYEIVDTLPAGMTYEPGSATPEPDVTMSGGQQVLTWTLDGVETNVEHDLTYEAVADDSVEPGEQLTNVAESRFGGEASAPVEETVTTTTNGFTTILKTSDVEFIPNDEGDGVGSGSWTVAIESFDPLPQAFTDTIDILPYVGDQRGTSFSGTYSLDDVVLPDGGTVYYTDADPATLTDDPADPDNGAAGDPTGNTVGWTTTAPDEPTAIRVIGGELSPGGTFSFQVVISTDGAEMGDTYVNRAQARAEHTELVMRTSAALVVTDYVVVKTSDPESGSTVEPGDTINYTITVTQQGPVPAGALLTDDMTDVVDDAVYNDDLAADLGNVELVDGVIHWDGVIPVGGVATITYSVTVLEIPELDEGLDEGEANTLLHNTVASPGCVSVEDCEVIIDTGWYEYSKTSVVEPGATVELGEVITYTVEITQRGEGAVPDARIEDDLSAVFDDAEWNNDLAASAGEASLDASTLSWSTDLLEVGEVVTVTYSVTVGVGGDSELANVVTTDHELGVCVPAPDENPDCETDHRLGGFLVEKTSDPVSGSEVEEGEVVTYTVTVTHVGVTGVEASFVDDVSQVLDDALWNYDLQASDGEASFAEPTLSWDGMLFPGDVVTVTYSVTATDGGDRRLVNVVTTPGVCVPVDGQDQACVTKHNLPEVAPIADSAPPHGAPDWLPRTGASLLWIAAAGLLVLLGGAGLVGVSRRPRRLDGAQHQ